MANIDPRDPVYSETLELIRSTSHAETLGLRCDGLSRIAREFDRLQLDVPAGLKASICELQVAIDYAIKESEGSQPAITYREYMQGTD